MLLRSAQLIDRLVASVGRLAAWAVLGAVLLTFAVVVLRHGLQRGSIALQELALHLHALAFMLGIAWTLQQDGHVRVDLLRERLGVRGRAWIELSGTLLCLVPFCLFVLWISQDYVAASWRIREGSREAGGLPGLYLVKSLIPAMALLLLLQGIAQGLKALAVLRGQDASQPARAAESGP